MQRIFVFIFYYNTNFYFFYIIILKNTTNKTSNAVCVRHTVHVTVTGQLADTPTRGLDDSRTGQLADWTTRGCHQRLCMLSFRSFGSICETASWQSASCPVTRVTQTALLVLSVVFFKIIM